jgi:formate dehydrogenase subunit gamma
LTAPFQPWNAERARALVSAHRSADGGLLPALQELQAEFGFIPETAIALVADIFNLSRADVFGVVSFYHDFRSAPAGRHTLKLCRAEACQAVGGDALAADVQAQLKVKWNETTADGRITVEPVFCLGLCASGPSAMLDGEPVARLTREKIHALVETLE